MCELPEGPALSCFPDLPLVDDTGSRDVPACSGDMACGSGEVSGLLTVALGFLNAFLALLAEDGLPDLLITSLAEGLKMDCKTIIM